MLSGPVGFALRLAGIGKGVQVVGQAVGQGQQEAVQNDTLLRTLHDVGVDFDTLRNKVRGTADALGTTIEHVQSLAIRYGRTAGTGFDISRSNGVGTEKLLNQVKFAGGFARGYGLDMASTADTFAKLDNAGTNPKAVALAVGDVMREGGMEGKTDQVMNALLKWSEGASRTLVNQTQVLDFAIMYAGLNATGMAGFRGANAEAVIGQLNTSIAGGGGGGMAGQVLSYRALARAGIKDPYDQAYVLAGGIFGRGRDLGAGHEGQTQTNFDVVRNEINREYAGRPANQRLMTLSTYFGANMRQAQALDSFKPGEIGRTADTLAGYGIDITKVNPTALADIGQVVGKDANLGDLRTSILKDNRYGLSTKEQDDLRGLSGEHLREGLVRTLATHGMAENEGTRTTESSAALSNAMTKMGSELVPALYDLKTGLATVSDAIHQEIDTFTRFLNLGKNGNTPGASAAENSREHPTGGGYGGDLEMHDAGGAGYTPISFRSRAGSSGGDYSGGGGQPLSATEKSARAAQTMKYFQGQVWSRAAAAAITSQAIAESGLREGAIGDHGAAHSLLQWHGDRFADVSAGIGMRADSSFEAGLAAIQFELTHGHDAGMLEAGRRLRLGGSAGDLAATLSKLGIRPGDREGAARTRAGIANRLMGVPDESGARGISRDGTMAGGIRHSIAPLQVIHRTESGRQLGAEYLPITQAPIPRAWNT
jgi:hypothetical protein